MRLLMPMAGIKEVSILLQKFILPLTYFKKEQERIMGGGDNHDKK
jgi:hypothetical protein